MSALFLIINLWLVEKYKAERKAQGKKPETINKELGVLRRMFNLAMEWKTIGSNPILRNEAFESS